MLNVTFVSGKTSMPRLHNFLLCRITRQPRPTSSCSRESCRFHCLAASSGGANASGADPWRSQMGRPIKMKSPWTSYLPNTLTRYLLTNQLEVVSEFTRSSIIYFCSCLWTNESSLLRRLCRLLHLCVSSLLLQKRKHNSPIFDEYQSQSA